MAVGSGFIEHLAGAIRFDTSHAPGTSEARRAMIDLHSYLAASYRDIWAGLDVEDVAEGSLLIIWTGSEPALEPIILLGHLDVMPSGDDTTPDWSSPPFDGATTSTHLIGRGAIDDKGSVVAMLEAVSSLLAEGFAPARTVILCLGHDEESGGSAGAAVMAAALAQRNTRAHLVLDEGGFVTERVLAGTKQPIALVGICEKGYMDVALTATASPGHSSMPPERTAIGALTHAIQALLENQAPARPEFQAAFFEAVSKAARWGFGPILGRLPRLPMAARILGARPSTNALIRTTIAPTMIEGGVKSNVLPGSARATVNVRLLPGDSVATMVERMKHTVGEGVEVELLAGWEASPVSSTESDAYRQLIETVEAVFPDAVCAPWTVIGATDARHYTDVSDNVFRFLPFRLDASELNGFHGVDERVRLDSGPTAVGFYRLLIEHTCS